MNKRILQELLAKYDTEQHNERCGLIIKKGRGFEVIECDNKALEPEKGYEIAPEEVIKYEKVLAGTWHTHPDENSNLSERDYLGFLMWPKLRHYIIGLNGISCYVVEDGVVLNAD